LCPIRREVRGVNSRENEERIFVYIDSSNGIIFHHRHLDFPIPNTLVHAPEDVYKYLLEVLSPLYEDSEVQPDENNESMV